MARAIRSCTSRSIGGRRRFDYVQCLETSRRCQRSKTRTYVNDTTKKNLRRTGCRSCPTKPRLRPLIEFLHPAGALLDDKVLDVDVEQGRVGVRDHRPGGVDEARRRGASPCRLRRLPLPDGDDLQPPALVRRLHQHSLADPVLNDRLTDRRLDRQLPPRRVGLGRADEPVPLPLAAVEIL